MNLKQYMVVCKMNIVILGDGLLGKEIHKQVFCQWDVLSRKKDGIDFRNIDTYKDKLEHYDVIINCIANTNTYSEVKEEHWDTNVLGTSELVDYCVKNNKKLVHISTDFVYANSVKNASEEDVPVHCKNWYGYTKLVSDAYVQLKMKNYLLIRCSFTKNPFPYKKALVNRIGNFDTVDTISEIIVRLIIKNKVGLFNVGTNLKSMYDLAKLNSDEYIEPINTMTDENMPTDVSMNIEKLNNEIKN
jgi:dTDP-4-dehydrorhamnose reductase